MRPSRPLFHLFLLTVFAGAAALAVSACDRVDLPTPEPGERRIEVDLRNFEFRPGVIEVEAGQLVGFELTSSDIRHTFNVPGTGIETEVRAGVPVLERFTFERSGEYTVICTIAGHADAGMVGKVVVR